MPTNITPNTDTISIILRRISNKNNRFTRMTPNFVSNTYQINTQLTTIVQTASGDTQFSQSVFRSMLKLAFSFG